MKKRILGIALAGLICCSALTPTAAAAEITYTATNSGVDVATVILSDQLSETTQQVRWKTLDSYKEESITISQVAYGSTCTIRPSNNRNDESSPLFITFAAYTMKSDVLESSNLASMRLVGNGCFSPKLAPYTFTPETKVTSAAPAKLVFGKNDSNKILKLQNNDYPPLSSVELKPGYIYKISISTESDFFSKQLYYFSIADSQNTAIENNQVVASPTASKILLDGKSVSMDAYNINSNNYCKIRDVAILLNGTGKQFEVIWDKTLQAVSMTSNHAYTAVGGELAKGDGATKTATLNTAKIYLDGKEISLTAYTIGGNNYIKLRDLGQTFEFGVSFDSTVGAVRIDTSKGYTPD